MEDLSFREFKFLLEIGTGSVEELISPAIEGIEPEEWNLTSLEWRKSWLDRTSKEWAAEYIEVSWR